MGTTEIYGRAGQIDDALSYSRRALAIHDRLHGQYPTRPQYLQQLVWSLLNLGNLLTGTGRGEYAEAVPLGDRAVAIYEGLTSDYPEVVDLRDRLVEALVLKAAARIQVGDQDEGERAIARLEKVGTATRAAGGLAAVAWHLVRPEVPRVTEHAFAADLANRALALDPRSAYAHHVMGLARYRASQWDETIAALTRSDELEPDRRLVVNGFILAMAYHRKGDADQARAWFDRATSRMADLTPHGSEAAPSSVAYRKSLRAEAAEVLSLEVPGVQDQ